MGDRNLTRHEVFDVLLSRSRARLLASASLGDGLGAAMWCNGRDETRYARPGHHTLSLYLAGGHGTYRTEAPTRRGEPGRVCLMPAGHESNWVVGGEQRFLHLYFDAEHLAPLALRLLDREPRDLGLPELTFIDAPALSRPLQAIGRLDWQDPQSRLEANTLAHGMLAQLVSSHAGRPYHTGARQGGLAPAVRRRLAEWIDHHLADAITVGAMAAQAALSEHHFARMFRVSFGMAPHAWVLQRRLERARQLLRGTGTLEQVAQSCGLASASHLVRRFRAQTGLTPGDYRRAMR
jgi:AraC family transcriptional regulator